jgi:GR25 family glycosyltransferase involved in LPS biosynthesis
MKNLLSDINIYCINLSSRSDRKRFMEQQFKEAGVEEKVTFIKAISSHSLGQSKIIDTLSASESANLLSHLKALKALLDSKNEFAIIMEDDCNIENAKRFKTTLAESFNRVGVKNICVQLMVNVREEQAQFKGLKIRTFWEFSTVAYFIDKRYAESILKNFNTLRKINEYPRVEILDPRNQKTFKRKRSTETIIYSGNSYSIPILTSTIIKPDIKHLNKKESIDQEIASAQKTDSLWVNQSNLDFFEYFYTIKTLVAQNTCDA